MTHESFPLQRFSDAGELVNTSTGQDNAYDSDPSSALPNLSAGMKTFYDTELLENARAEHYFTQFGRRMTLPRNHGRIVEWRKWTTLPNADRLIEGVIPAGKQFGQTSVTASVDQFGMYVTVSDILDLHAVDDVIVGAAEELGASAGSTQDTLTRNALLTGTNVLYAGGRTSRAAVGAADVLDVTLVNRAYTKLRKMNTPTVNGKYIAVIHPSVAYDLREDADWIDVHKYASAAEIYNGEIGELHNVRFVVSPNAKVLRGDDLAADSRTLTVNREAGYTGAVSSVAFDGGEADAGDLAGRTVLINGVRAVVASNTSSSMTFTAATDFGTVADNTVIYPGEGGAEGGAVYASLFFGHDAYGIVDPEGGGLQMIIKNRGEVGGPLEQFSTVGYKFEGAARILYDERILRVETGSYYANEDAAN